MDFSLTTLALLMLAGLTAGFIDSTAGGGGIITVPALLMAGVPPHIALGTNKLQASFGSFTSALRYRNGGLVRWRTMWLGVVSTALGASAGTLLVQRIPEKSLALVIPVLLLIVFVYMLASPTLGRETRPQRMPTRSFYLGVGFAMGVYDGAIGPGTGSFWTIAFVALLGLDLRRATAHTKVVNFSSNIVSLSVFAVGGHVLLIPGLLMGLAQVGGAWIGSHMLLKRGTGFVRTLFLIVVGITILRLIYIELWSS